MASMKPYQGTITLPKLGITKRPGKIAVDFLFRNSSASLDNPLFERFRYDPLPHNTSWQSQGLQTTESDSYPSVQRTGLEVSGMHVGKDPFLGLGEHCHGHQGTHNLLGTGHKGYNKRFSRFKVLEDRFLHPVAAPSQHINSIISGSRAISRTPSPKEGSLASSSSWSLLSNEELERVQRIRYRLHRDARDEGGPCRAHDFIPPHTPHVVTSCPELKNHIVPDDTNVAEVKLSFLPSSLKDEIYKKNNVSGVDTWRTEPMVTETDVFAKHDLPETEIIARPRTSDKFLNREHIFISRARLEDTQDTPDTQDTQDAARSRQASRIRENKVTFKLESGKVGDHPNVGAVLQDLDRENPLQDRDNHHTRRVLNVIPSTSVRNLEDRTNRAMPDARHGHHVTFGQAKSHDCATGMEPLEEKTFKTASLALLLKNRLSRLSESSRSHGSSVMQAVTQYTKGASKLKGYHQNGAQVIRAMIERRKNPSPRLGVYGAPINSSGGIPDGSHRTRDKQDVDNLLGEDQTGNEVLSSRMSSYTLKVETWRTSGPEKSYLEQGHQPRVRHSASLPSLMSFLPRNIPKVAVPANKHTSICRSGHKSPSKRDLQPRTNLMHVSKHSSTPTWKMAKRLNVDSYVMSGTRKALRKTRSQGDLSKLSTAKNFMPLVKFRRVVKMVLHLLRATYNSRERSQRRERYNLWASFLGSTWTTSKRAYEMYGISFDPQDFKANREIQVTVEAKAILSLEPSRRTHHQLRQVLLSLRQAVNEFSEFPITMQESLVRVGWYEHFEAKRVIIRQGHTADNFYFILSGTAVVIVLETDKQTGEQTARTAAFLGKGKSFGELALMHKSRRSATVTCRDDVELLAVGREDFIDIFMHVERDVEPEHVRFLRSLQILRNWPIEVLPVDNPQTLLFTYVRRGVLLCRDSNSSDWIYVVKSGHCSVIKALRAVTSRGSANKNVAPHQSQRSDISPYIPLPSIRQKSSYTLQLASQNQGRCDVTFSFIKDAEEVERERIEHMQTLDAILEQRHAVNSLTSSATNVTGTEPDHFRSNINDLDTKKDPGDNLVFVEILKLAPRDIYGLESCVFKSMNKTTSTSLVSGGAELIMINRKFFLDRTSEQLRKQIRKEIRPLPSEEDLQAQLETMVSWEAYRNVTLKKTVDSVKRKPH